MPEAVLEGADQVKAAVGRHLGHSEWIVVDQEQVDLFARATGDHQPVHAEGEHVSGAFAQCHLILALTNLFLPQIVEVRGFSLGINYGVDRVRFPAPVPVGSRIRAGAELVSVDDVPGGVQTRTRITVEIHGSDTPACVVEALSRYQR